MVGDVKYPKLRRSIEKKLTRKTDDNERLFMKWMIQKSNKIRNINPKT
ncbi:hypothetical protein N0O92_03150 [Alkalihalobacillus sp. MEB130]|nr:hypothetical protein [Alkalihalobacillus sp. MEB130]MDT8859215.1 hypothetical protein [Alkalihalobacillus sp. MEB130]